MLRSPAVPSMRDRCVDTAEERGVPVGLERVDDHLDRARGPSSARARHRAVLPKDTTPILTSLGTLARKALTAARTVAIPAAPMDPLVSMRSTVDAVGRRAADGFDDTGGRLAAECLHAARVDLDAEVHRPGG